MNRTLLVQRYPAVEIACSTQQVHPSLSVVALIRVIYFRLRQKQDLSTKGIPLDLRAVRLEECLLTCRWTIERD